MGTPCVRKNIAYSCIKLWLTGSKPRYKYKHILIVSSVQFSCGSVKQNFREKGEKPFSIIKIILLNSTSESFNCAWLFKYESTLK